MNAKEARRKATEIILVKNKSIIEDVLSIIKESVDRGELECWYYYTIPDEIISLIKKDGYEIKYQQTGMNENGYLISW